MAERRMFAKTIVTSDAFLDMPATTRCLYFLLAMTADDDGFVNNPNSIMRQSGATKDDMNLLIAKRFVLTFQSGVVVIKHWCIHNTIQKDRYKETKYLEEKALLALDENKAYTEAVPNVYPECIQDVSNQDTQVRLGKDREGKDRLGEGSKGKKETTHDLLQRLLPEYIIPPALAEKMVEWISYKTERKETYKEVGMKSLLRQIENNQIIYGEKAVMDLIDDSMANGWKGIIFDRLKQKTPQNRSFTQKKNSNPFLDMLEDNYE